MIHDLKIGSYTVPANTEKIWNVFLPHSVDTFDFSSACNNVPQSVRVYKVDHGGSNCLQVFSITLMTSGQYCGARLQKDGYQIRVAIKANAGTDTIVNWRIKYNIQ